ncbi:MAG: DUF3488 and DUF4129 domain-containing transglutaminase family protein [Gammaproteobacteria bacterium]
MTQVELATFQVSRRALPWIIAAVIAALLPHVTHLPLWLTGVAVLCIGWRVGVHRGQLAYPPRRLQGVFALALMAGIFIQYRTLAGHQAGTAMLVAMFSLKLLEMYKERDAYVVILIGYFVAAMAFLFFFTVWMGFYVVGVATLFTAALVAINASLDMPRSEPIRRAGSLVLQSVPIAILLFVVMPRIGPMWSIGLKPGESQTGVGDEMSFGDIGNLSRSDDMAFRVDFDDGNVPPTARLYWRGMTLTEFDGRTWRQLPGLAEFPSLVDHGVGRAPEWRQRLRADLAALEDAQTFRYTVIMEPSQRPWLFALVVPEAAGRRDIGLVYDHRLRMREPVKTVTRYRVASVPSLQRDVELADWLREQSLALPRNSNPLARQWALQARAEMDDDLSFVRHVLGHFREEPFSYTLSPPRLGEQVVDDFLFVTRSGFCEHYASTFVFLMRAAGIPARIVAGYQGGEVNPLSGTVQVRQYDAHAWAEVWLPGRGWVEFDPTSAVAPERIDRGARAAIGNQPGFLADEPLADLWSPGSTLAAFRDALDYLNHGWNIWVLGYDDAAQQGFLKRWLGKYSPYRIGLAVLGFAVLVGGLLALWLFRETLFRRVDPLTREYRRFCNGWARRGHPRRDDEGPHDYADRLCAAAPERAADVQRFIKIYVQLVYAGRELNRQSLRDLRNARSAAF